jgi:hypothetical protein
MGKKRPVVGLTALWIGLAVFGCDCCRNKGTTYRNPSTFNPPAGGSNVSSSTPGTPGNTQVGSNAGVQGSNPTGNFQGSSPTGNFQGSNPTGNFQGSNPTGNFQGSNPIGSNTRSTGMSDPYNTPYRSDPYSSGRSTTPGLDSGTTVPSRPTSSSSGAGMSWNDTKSSSGSGVTPAGGSTYPDLTSPSSGMGASRSMRDDPTYMAPSGKSNSDSLWGNSDSTSGRNLGLDGDRKMPSSPAPTSLPSTRTMPDTLVPPPGTPLSRSAPTLPPATPLTGASPDVSPVAKDPLGAQPPPVSSRSAGATADAPPPLPASLDSSLPLGK